ncbi:MAG: peptide-methionine (S)-S-oxide reductase MsrA [Bacteroidales bacterium]|nr:peptide-methionine (S)-S-oxide reductase MsrA [Bacteroidales bacterium]
MEKKEIYLAGGCFWGVEHFFSLIEGVISAEAGYANGNEEFRGNPEGEGPSYKEVYTDRTGFAETVRITYSPDIIPLSELIKLYFKIIDPYSVNRQAHDAGTRYRTGIYYTDPEELSVINPVYDELEREGGKKFAVELLPLKNFFRAEEYHQEYLDKNPGGYCHLPLEMFRFAKNYKPDNNKKL